MKTKLVTFTRGHHHLSSEACHNKFEKSEILEAEKIVISYTKLVTFTTLSSLGDETMFEKT